jgi:hypothetical protein
VGPAAGAGAAWLSLESVKKSKVFQSATASLGIEIDQLLELGEARLTQRLIALAPFRRFVIANERPLRQIATNTVTMRWMLPYIDFIVQHDEI